MVRWKYFIPRLTLLACILGGLVFGLNPLLRLAMIQGGQAALGARVEIGGVQTRVSGGELRLANLVIASPNSPLKNMLQAESAVFDVEMGSVLRRKLFIRDGHVEGLQFHTDRDTDGRLSPTDEPDEADGESGVASMLKGAGQRGEAWLNDSLGKLELEADNELETVKLSRELKARWPAEYATLETRAKQIETQSRQLRDLVKLIADEPLAHLDKVQPALASVETLRRDAVDVRQRAGQLQQQMKHDRQALKLAKDHDVAYIRERLKLDELDGDSLSEYLLGPVWSERVATAMRWIQWTRKTMPTNSLEKEREAYTASRGISVVFPGYPSLPDVLIRNLRLSGTGTIEATPFTFSGTLRDLTHQPERHAEPARLDVEANGAIQLTANVVLDRRGPQAVDEIVVDLPSVRQHGQRLGKPEKLAVEISPGTARIQAHVFVRDDELSGQITLHQDQIQVKPLLAEKYAKYVTPASLATAMSGVSELNAHVLLSGTVLRPRYKLQSNLGPQISLGLNQAVRQELVVRQQQLLARANREVEDELNQLQGELVAKHGKILEQLELGDTQLDQFKKHLLSGAGSPQELISRGRKLLFK